MEREPHGGEEGSLGEREQALQEKFDRGELTMDEFYETREEAHKEKPSKITRDFYHDLTNKIMVLYEGWRDSLESMVDQELVKKDLNERFNSDLAAVEPYKLSRRELDLFHRWQGGLLSLADLPDPNTMQEIYDTAGDRKESLKHFYSWLRNEIAIAPLKERNKTT